MLALGGVAVQRCRFPVVDPSDRTGQGSIQSLGRVEGATHGELDLLVDLAGQAPGLILGPHEVRFLIALRGAVLRQSGCVSECSDRAGEQQHHSLRNLHSCACGAGAPLIQPSHIAAYPLAGVAV